MLIDFAKVLVFLVVSALFIFITLIAGRFFRPTKPNPVKSESYECGEEPTGSGWINFNIRFYLIALIFVIFDVEVALAFPVATVFKKWITDGNGLIALIELGVFVLILFVGLVYVWAKKDLEWVKTVLK